MGVIENFAPAGRQPRVTVQTDIQYLPFPLLRSPQKKLVADFWGFKYDIAVLPLLVWLPPNKPLVLGATDPLPFAVYADAERRRPITPHTQKS